MYTDASVRSIVEYYRRPIPPAPLKNADDAKSMPNAILLSYLVEAEAPCRTQLSELLMKPALLEQKLRAHAPTPQQPPLLLDGITHDMPLDNIAASLRTHTGKFAYGYEDKLLFADAAPREHCFPSGKTAQYYSLSNEITANYSVFSLGCSLLEPDRVFIRENSLLAMAALADAAKHDNCFAPFRPCLYDISEHIPGIIIAHELSEMEIFKSGNAPENRLDLELESERRAADFLQKNGVSVGHYRVFHMLRAAEHGEGKNVSRAVLESNPAK
jgi:hypothetical protein